MLKKIATFLGLQASSSATQGLAKKFQTEGQFAENVELQRSLTPQTLETLYSHGVTVDTELKLEYYFYTNSEEKAAALHEALGALGYSGEFGQTADDTSLFIVTGWSVPVLMSEEAALSWTETMCQIGLEHDAKFDGWGTNPEQ